MPDGSFFIEVENETGAITQAVFGAQSRVMIFGEQGAGKSTLALGLARDLFASGRSPFVISADPGSPPFGAPGAVTMARWDGESFRITGMEALCSLDAARFRMPLAAALRRLAEKAPPSSPLIIDSPGVVRGVAGAELLAGMADAAKPGCVIVLSREVSEPPLAAELAALGLKIFIVPADPRARRHPRGALAGNRTALWDGFLKDTAERRIDLGGLHVIGTPPPIEEDGAWEGRQAALLGADWATLAMGEIISKKGPALTLKAPPFAGEARLLLVRDARRVKGAKLATSRITPRGSARYAPPPDIAPEGYLRAIGPRPVVHTGSAAAALVNGVFGDPLLHIRLRRERRSLLFDLGEAIRLPARIAHQVTDVFISHTHIDHIGGFLWLLRSRIGYFPPVRMFGPPGLAQNILGMIRGVSWDRIGDRGPRFEIAELHGATLERFVAEAGKPELETLVAAPVKGGAILTEPRFTVRAVTLDHGVPSLAFSFEPPVSLNIRKERLAAMGLPPGPWLGELKLKLLQGDRGAPVTMPDGRIKTAGEISDELVLEAPGSKIVYAADLAYTPDNSEKLISLALRADVLFLEAAFAREDAEQAELTQHLTAEACGRIASAAGVRRLIPFHFSKRYEEEPERIYQEVLNECPRAVIPEAIIDSK